MKSTLTCTGVITLADGTFALQGNASPNARTTTVAVTGGTGAYANARGVYVERTGVRRLVDDDHARRLIGAHRSRRRSAATAQRADHDEVGEREHPQAGARGLGAAERPEVDREPREADGVVVISARPAW